jgi:hypothetical protein
MNQFDQVASAVGRCTEKEHRDRRLVAAASHMVRRRGTPELRFCRFQRCAADERGPSRFRTVGGKPAEAGQSDQDVLKKVETQRGFQTLLKYKAKAAT